jgi:hypothetical protein
MPTLGGKKISFERKTSGKGRFVNRKLGKNDN